MGVLSFLRGRGQFTKAALWRNFYPVQKRRWYLLCIASALLWATVFSNPAAADRFRAALRDFAAGNYAKAVTIFTELARRGDARAQTYLGYMFANGVGVPQSFIVAAGWYRCASQQGVPQARYMLGLMYDKGQGVPQDYVMAYALLDLAVAGAGRERERWALIRDAVASKLSLIERGKAQQLAFNGPPIGQCLPIVVGD
jgi:uncharacterized protein